MRLESSRWQLEIVSWVLMFSLVSCGSEHDGGTNHSHPKPPCVEHGQSSDECLECFLNASSTCKQYDCKESFDAAMSCFEAFDCIDEELRIPDEACAEQHCPTEKEAFETCFMSCPALLKCGLPD